MQDLDVLHQNGQQPLLTSRAATPVQTLFCDKQSSTFT